MDKLTCMRAFADVVEAGGFSQAARRVGLSKALISKHVAQLEAALKVRLLHRTTRQMSPTPLGAAYYERCRMLLAELDELEAAVQEAHATPTGELRVSAPGSFAELHLMAPVAALCARYPAVQVSLQLTDRYVDLVQEGIDVAIRIAELPDSSLVARPLAAVRIITCAAPGYLQVHGEPQHPKQLDGHRCIIDTNYEDTNRWLFLDAGQRLRVPVSGPVWVNGALATRALALSASGIARIPSFVVGEDIRAGHLRAILEPYEPPELWVYAVYPHRRHLSARVRLFIDTLVESFGSESSWMLPPAAAG